MSVTYKCDGCGTTVEQRSSFKPSAWFVRGQEGEQQHACSRPCIEKIAEATGSTRVVLPF